jgi:sporulation protein YlmC with PRC-barrel domain
MDLQFGQHVRSSDGEDIGKIKHLILDPTDGQVKTLVVERGMLLPDDVEIPAGDVQQRDNEGISVRYTAEQLLRLPRFDESKYTPVNLEQARWFLGFPYTGALWPVGYPLQPFGAGAALAAPVIAGETALAPPPEVRERMRQQAQENAVISAGDAVLSKDGHQVGEVHGIAFDAATGAPTSLEIRRGWLFHKDFTLPGDAIASFEAGAVTLKLDKAELEARRSESREAAGQR